MENEQVTVERNEKDKIEEQRYHHRYYESDSDGSYDYDYDGDRYAAKPDRITELLCCCCCCCLCKNLSLWLSAFSPLFFCVFAALYHAGRLDNFHIDVVPWF